MLTITRGRLAALAATGALALTGAGSAQAATTQEGLVNVSLTDTTVQVPVAVAANVCQVQANVIASNNVQDPGLCTSISRSTAQDGGGGGGNTRQSGLVNVAVTDLTVQIPVGVAANVCNVQANVIASGNVQDPGLCTAISRPSASA
jgi:hypothetical protein